MKNAESVENLMLVPIVVAICFGSAALFKYIMLTTSYVKFVMGN